MNVLAQTILGVLTDAPGYENERVVLTRYIDRIATLPPGEGVREAGLKSLAQVGRYYGKSAQTLHNWRNDCPRLYAAAVLTAAIALAGDVE